MALGGGRFVGQNKILPGTYTNFISAAGIAATLSERGYAAIAVPLSWGPANEIIEMTQADFNRNCKSILGYENTHESLKGLRDLFKNIKTAYLYRLNGNGAKASNDLATAKYSGVRGNAIKVSVYKDIDQPEKFCVDTLFDNIKVDSQLVEAADELKDNDYVTFKKDAELEAVLAKPLEGGTDGTITGSEHQNFLDKLEVYSVNAIGCISTEDSVKQLYTNYCKRMREEVGKVFQTVVFQSAADYEGVINVKNKVVKDAASSLIYWVTGLIAGCPVNASASNRLYDGEFEIDTDFTQAQLEGCILKGEFVLHKVNQDIRVLQDINSLITETENKNSIFKSNKTIRVIDQLAMDEATLFNTRHLGVTNNDDSGRIALWQGLVKIQEALIDLGVLTDFDPADTVVEAGEEKDSVVTTKVIRIVGTMEKLYITTTVA